MVSSRELPNDCSSEATHTDRAENLAAMLRDLGNLIDKLYESVSGESNSTIATAETIEVSSYFTWREILEKVGVYLNGRALCRLWTKSGSEVLIHSEEGPFAFPDVVAPPSNVVVDRSCVIKIVGNKIVEIRFFVPEFPNKAPAWQQGLVAQNVTGVSLFTSSLVDYLPGYIHTVGSNSKEHEAIYRVEMHGQQGNRKAGVELYLSDTGVFCGATISIDQDDNLQCFYVCPPMRPSEKMYLFETGIVMQHGSRWANIASLPVNHQCIINAMVSPECVRIIVLPEKASDQPITFELSLSSVFTLPSQITGILSSSATKDE